MLPDGVVAWRREAAASAPSQVTRNHGSMAAVYPIFGQTDWWNMAIDPDNMYIYIYGYGQNPRYPRYLEIGG